MFLPVILAGGAGTRLWPLSSERLPKPFHALGGTQSLLQRTAERLRALDACAPLIVCSEEHRFLAAEHLRRAGVADAAFLLEPFGRNTAPALALAALYAEALQDNPLLLVLPADHVIADVPRFRKVIETAAPLARGGHIVTFGIAPDRADTGYGYIRSGAPLGDGLAFAVAGFEEKPERATAEHYLAVGAHYWNSGMFMVRASRYLEELDRHQPAIASACRAALPPAARDAQFIHVDAEAFQDCPSLSIDHAVMEKTDAAAIVPLDAGWSDIGTWQALWRAGPRDEDGNLLQGDALAIASRDSLVHAASRRVVIVGIENAVVIETGDTVLVASRDAVDEAGDVAERVRRHRQKR